MIDYLDLARRLKGKSVGSSGPEAEADLLMPWAYQFANPKGRPFHDDWSLWPFTRVRRMDTWYRLPLPFKAIKVSGFEPKWMPWQEGYPEAPGAQFRAAAPGAVAWSSKLGANVPISREVLAYDPVPPIGGSGLFAVWLDGAWRECFFTDTRIVDIPLVGKRRRHTNRVLKCDMTFGDFGCQFPDASYSLGAL